MEPIKVLIAEDEILIARTIESALKKLGYVVTGIATDGLSAIEKVAATKPDIALMDILMPGEIDGIEAATQIRSQFQIPVVYLTAYGDRETVERAKKSEPFGYLIKPFQAQELNTTIQVALVRQRLEQQKLATLRTNITTSLPHEVNTSLTGILGSINFLVNAYHSLNSSEVLEILELIQISANRLEQVHQNFLLYTKLELLATDPEAIQELRKSYTFSTRKTLNHSITQSVQQMNREADLQMNLVDTSVQISETYLWRIVKELVDNALKFSHSGSMIRVTSSRINQMFVLSVSDQGRGMTAEQIASLDTFMQFERQRYEQQGLGFGLTLVKRLVELHGGKMRINSEVGKGTRVAIQLPIADCDSPS